MRVITNLLKFLEETVVHLWYTSNKSLIQCLEISLAFMVKPSCLTSSQLSSLLLNATATCNRIWTA